MKTTRYATICLLALAALLPHSAEAAPGDTLFPDLIVPANNLYDHDMVGTVQLGRVHLRLSVGVANVGSGPVHFYGVRPDNGDGTQNVNQRIFVDFGPPIDQYAGTFIYHGEHGHIHFADWTQYRIRQRLADDSVGAIVAEGMKTSFCIVDERIFSSGLPNFDPNGGYFSCGVSPNAEVIQGLSVGWQDVYDKSLPDQNIDITGVPSGSYWLEVEADPENRIQESNEFNNITRIPLTLSALNVDPYEPNDAIYMLDDRQTGAPRSPNLGPCDPEVTLTNLTLHIQGDRDYFSFLSNHVGGINDFVSISWFTGGRLVLELLDQNYSSVQQVNGLASARISLTGLPEGLYYVKVISVNGNANSGYSLTINPPGNQSPEITATEPGSADTVNWSTDTYTVQWNFSDPESDACWVTVFANTSPQFDGNEIELPGTLLTPASQQFAVINSAYLLPVTYFFYTQITDAGTTTGDWSTGTVTFRPPSCCTKMGNVDCGENGNIDIADLLLLIDHIFLTYPALCCLSAADLSGDLVVDNVDLLMLIDHMFLTNDPLPDCP